MNSPNSFVRSASKDARTNSTPTKDSLSTSLPQTYLNDALLQNSFDSGEILGNEVFRICIVGSTGCGKTAIVHRFIDGIFNEQDIPTLQSTKMKKIQINSNKFVFLEILDTGGELKLHEERHDNWYNWAEGFVLCYDTTNTQSFEMASLFRKLIEKTKKSQDIPMILVGNFVDRDARRKISKSQGNDLAKSFKDCSFVEVSAKTGVNIDSIFATLLRDIRTKKAKQVSNPLFGKKLNRATSTVGINQLVSNQPVNFQEDFQDPSQAESSKTIISRSKSYDQVVDLGSGQVVNPTDSPQKVGRHTRHFSTSMKEKDTLERALSEDKDTKYLSFGGGEKKRHNIISKLGKLGFNSVRRTKSSASSEDIFAFDDQESPRYDFVPSEDLWSTPVSKPRSWSEVETIPDKNNDIIDPVCRNIGFRIELGGKTPPNTSEKEQPIFIETTQNDEPFYAKQLAEFEHANFVCLNEDTTKTTIGPVVLSLEIPTKDNADDKKAILRTKKGTERFLIPHSKCSSLKTMIKYVKFKYIQLATSKFIEISPNSVDESVHQFIVQQLIEYEQKQAVSHLYKFGVVYVSEKQRDEDSIFGNTTTSASYEDFLQFIGGKISLEGWDGYRAGLDVKKNTTGTHSVYTKHRGCEIMFHVATLLPYQADDKQRLERKRHIGNDIIVIVFKEDDTPFDPSIFTSHFNHVFCVVQVDKRAAKPTYKIGIANKIGVPPYSPFLDASTYEKNENFRDILLTKLINGERAALNAPEFRDKMTRTRHDLLTQIVKDAIGANTTSTTTTKEKEKEKKQPVVISGSTGNIRKVTSNENLTATVVSGNENSNNNQRNSLGETTKEKKKSKSGKGSSDILSPSEYYGRMAAYAKRLQDWSAKDAEHFEEMEFFYLSNEIAQFAVTEAAAILNENYRYLIASNARKIVIEASLLVAAYFKMKRAGDYLRKSDGLAMETELFQVRREFVDSLKQLLNIVEAAANKQQDSKPFKASKLDKKKGTSTNAVQLVFSPPEDDV